MFTYAMIEYIRSRASADKGFVIGVAGGHFDFCRMKLSHPEAVAVMCTYGAYGPIPIDSFLYDPTPGFLFYDLDEDCPHDRNFLTFVSKDGKVVIHWVLDGETFCRALSKEIQALLRKSNPVDSDGHFKWRQ